MADQDLKDIAEWLAVSGYPFDWHIGALPECLVAPLTEKWSEITGDSYDECYESILYELRNTNNN